MTLSRSKRLTANTDHDWEPVKASVGGTRWVCSRCGSTAWRAHGDEPEPDEWPCNPLKRTELKRGSGPSPVSDRRDEKRAHQRDEAFREYTRRSPSVVSGKSPCDPAHVYSWGSGRGDWMDDGTGNLVPLTREEHRELHRIGRETWEERYGVDLDVERVEHGERFEASEDGGE